MKEPSPQRLAALSSLLRSRKGEIVAAWEQAVVAAGVLEGKGMDRPALVDRIPALVERVAERADAAAAGAPPPSAQQDARAHAVERLEHGYDLDEVVAEFALLRRTIAARCAEDAPELGPAELALVHEVIDEAIASSATHFAAARAYALEALDRVSSVALASREVDSLLQDLLEVIRQAIPVVDALAFLLVDGDRLYVRAAMGPEAAQQQGVSLAIGEGFSGRVAAERRPLLLREAADDPGVRSELAPGRRPRALFGVPLEHAGRLLGVAYMGSPVATAFSNEELLLFRAMADRATAAIAHAETLTREQVEHATSRALASSSSLAEALPRLLAEIGTTCGWQVGSAWTPAADQTLRVFSFWQAPGVDAPGFEEASRGTTFRPGEGLPGRTLQSGETVWLSDVSLSRSYARKAAALDAGLRSAVAFPLCSEGRSLGVLEFYSDRLRSPAEVLVRLTSMLAQKLETFLQRLEAQDEARRRGDALHASEERLRLALHAAGLGTWEYDPEGRIVRFDERGTVLYGSPPGAALNYDDWLAHVHTDDRERVTAMVRRALASAGSESYDADYRIVAGAPERERWMHSSGRVVIDRDGASRFIGVHRDVTEIKAAHEAIRRSEREFRTVIETMPQFVWTARPDGRMDYINPRLANYFGDRADAFLDSAWSEVVHPDDLQNSVRAWSRAIATGEPLQVERRLRRNDGAYRWFLTRAVTLHDEGGRVRSWLGTSTDIDDLKQAEAELQRRAEFEQQLIGIVSHDLRNPMNVILLAAQVLLRSEGLTDRQTKTVVRLFNAAERATRLIRDLLDFTKARLGGGIPVERKPVDLHALIRDVLEEARAVHPDRTIDLTSSGDGQGEWDGDRLAQVTINLVNNALTYSPAETPVRVETAGNEHTVTLSVHNDGAPIPPEHLPRLFEPMHRAGEHGRAGGVGLGLFIVDNIVRAHGGHVDVRSSAGEGTTFRVVLPRAAPPA